MRQDKRKTIGFLVWVIAALIGIFLLSRVSVFNDDKALSDVESRGEMVVNDLVDLDPSSSNRVLTENHQANTKENRPSQSPENSDQEANPAILMLEDAFRGDLFAAMEFLNGISKCAHTDRLGIGVEESSSEFEDPALLRSAIRKGLLIDGVFVAPADARRNCLQFLNGADQYGDATITRVMQRIESEAESGNAFARFIYSMWSPTEREALLLGHEYLDNFERKAREYTESNRLSNGELWLLAKGLSYSSGKNFSPQRPALGSAYLMASSICGMQLAVIDYTLTLNSKLTLVLSVGETPVSDEEIAVLALDLASENCSDK